MLHTEARSAGTASRTLHRESLEAFYFKRYLTILYSNNLPLPHNPVIPLSLHYTTLCLFVRTMKLGAEHSQLIPNISYCSIYSDIKYFLLIRAWRKHF